MKYPDVRWLNNFLNQARQQVRWTLGAHTFAAAEAGAGAGSLILFHIPR